MTIKTESPSVSLLGKKIKKNTALQYRKVMITKESFLGLQNILNEDHIIEKKSQQDLLKKS